MVEEMAPRDDLRERDRVRARCPESPCPGQIDENVPHPLQLPGELEVVVCCEKCIFVHPRCLCELGQMISEALAVRLGTIQPDVVLKVACEIV